MIENTLTELINRKQTQSKPLVVIMSGVAGSGKTTFAKQLEDEGFIRLSIDEEVWATHGKYGVDYSVECYEHYQRESEAKLHNQLMDLIQMSSSTLVFGNFKEEICIKNELKMKVVNGSWFI